MELCCRATIYRPNSTTAPFFFTHTHRHKNVFKRCRILCVSRNSTQRAPKESQMSVSITGATGFIGRRLVQKLLEDDHTVHVLTRSRSKAQLVFPGKKLRNFPRLLLPRKENGKIAFKVQMLLLT